MRWSRSAANANGGSRRVDGCGALSSLLETTVEDCYTIFDHALLDPYRTTVPSVPTITNFSRLGTMSVGLFSCITEAERICHYARIVRIPAASNRLQRARLSHFPRSVGCIIATNAARPEPRRRSIGPASARSVPFHSLLGAAPKRGSPAKIVALDLDDHGDRIPRTDKF
jgi:hypothetical protein